MSVRSSNLKAFKNIEDMPGQSKPLDYARVALRFLGFPKLYKFVDAVLFRPLMKSLDFR